ncbi:hypothetical protein DL764_001336 [Monosporascus ibericus]|uniref:Uncharacterized protein n=1 Tax=Monosporascus ibericus TaxID=155417 RepID=A0A4V1XCC7_9PEZI|nr:hypothetical protein DL764_001336 [Monosporascus ibericus]
MEEASPYAPSPTAENSEMVLDLAVAYPCNVTCYGGQSGGYSRRCVGCIVELDITEASLVLSPRPRGMRKSNSSKKKRRPLVWIIGNQDAEGTARVALARDQGG